MATNIAVPPVMPTPTAPSAGLSIECIAGYLNSDPNKTAKALGNLAAGGYVIRVSSNPGRWVRVVPVEVDMMSGVVHPLAKKAAKRPPLEVPLAAVNPTMPTLPYFPQPEPEPEVEMVLVFGHMVPLSSVTFSSDSEEIAAPPRPRRPYVPAIPAQHAVDLQTARDAEHDANMARINREMAEAADAAQAAVEMNTGLVGRQRKPGEENLM